MDTGMYHDPHPPTSAVAHVGEEFSHDDSKFEAILDEADNVASLARSIAEAAFRRDRMVIALHVIELRRCGAGLVRAFRSLDAAVAA
jgi:hypothetical protein